ncbi:MAG: acyl-CoA carboxylase biotin carboxyl carrier protein subunit [Planctomycetota bacterium]|jgi:biotin carboxyl carrier protein
MATPVVAPMVSQVKKIHVDVGAEVQENDTLLTIEAMKVEMPIPAPVAGKVQAIHCKEGDTVEAETVLVDIE